MVKERWHDFAKEKPSEDMEGRNFIVSNGHYEKISTWCGYWENEPFMGDRLCDEVVRWKFYFTPEEEKANEATRTEPKADEVDAAIAELKQELSEKDKDIAYWREEYDKETQLTDALKDEIESLKASHYAESVDAGMRERRLRRALWRAIALFCARSCEYFNGIMSHCLMGQDDLYRRCEEKKNKYLHAMYKCRAKAEEYK